MQDGLLTSLIFDCRTTFVLTFYVGPYIFKIYKKIFVTWNYFCGKNSNVIWIFCGLKLKKNSEMFKTIKNHTRVGPYLSGLMGPLAANS